MELKVFRDVLCGGGGCCAVQAEIPVETEILISDYLPQVFKVVKCFARPVVLQKQLQPGRLTLEGYIRCTVYYQGRRARACARPSRSCLFTRCWSCRTSPLPHGAPWWKGRPSTSTAGPSPRGGSRCGGLQPGGVGVHPGRRRGHHRPDRLRHPAAAGRAAGVRRAAVLDKLFAADGTVAFAQPPAAVLDISGSAAVTEVKLLAGKAVVKGQIQALCAWKSRDSAALQSQEAAIPLSRSWMWRA